MGIHNFSVNDLVLLTATLYAGILILSFMGSYAS